MLDFPKVSIIVPVFNGAETIEACIRSLLALDYPDDQLELIFADNGSTDRTAEILKSYGNKIHVTYEAKRGPAAARNCGLRHARHETVAMTDADCTVDSNWLRHLIEPLHDPSVGLAGGVILSKRPCNAIELFGERIHDHRNAIEVWQPPYVITMNWASRKSVLTRVSFFDENFLRCEDVDLAYKVYQADFKVVYAPNAIVYHQNEPTYSKLFHEGYLHGYYSVQALKRHRILLRQHGHRRFQTASYAALLTSLKDALLSSRSEETRCDLIFNSGKKLGKLCGSFRFGYLEL